MQLFRFSVMELFSHRVYTLLHLVIGLSANSESNLKEKKANMKGISVEDAANFTGFQIITL